MCATRGLRFIHTRRKVFIPLALLAAAAGVVVPIVLKAKGRN